MRSNIWWRWLLCASIVLAGILVVRIVRQHFGWHLPLAEATWAPPSMPETHAGKQAAGYLQAFNSGDEEELTHFVHQHFTKVGPGGSTLDDRVRSQLRLYKSSRGLNVFQAEERGGGELDLLAQFRLTEEWRRMTFMVEDAPPHKITGVRIVPANAPAIPPQRAHRPLEIALNEYLVRLVEADEFSGVVAIARNGETVFAEPYGFADCERKVTNSLDTPFHYASVGKMFTALAIGQLADDGKLSLDDTLDLHLPQYPPTVAKQITLDHLLTHRSGILDYFAALEKSGKVRGGEVSQHDYVSLFAGEPLRFNPGERFEYSNSNFILLGAVVEHLSGQPFDTYLAEHIFVPAGMTATTLDQSGSNTVVPAIGYTELGPGNKLTPGHRRPNTTHMTGRGSAAGGGVTTAHDMINFAEALRAYRLLSPERTAELLTAQVDGDRPNELYARGFICRDSDHGRIVGHSGGFPGVDAQVDIYPDGWTVVVLANYEGVGEPVARHIEKLLTAEREREVAQSNVPGRS